MPKSLKRVFKAIGIASGIAALLVAVFISVWFVYDGACRAHTERDRQAVAESVTEYLENKYPEDDFTIEEILGASSSDMWAGLHAGYNPKEYDKCRIIVESGIYGYRFEVSRIDGDLSDEYFKAAANGILKQRLLDILPLGDKVLYHLSFDFSNSEDRIDQDSKISFEDILQQRKISIIFVITGETFTEYYGGDSEACKEKILGTLSGYIKNSHAAGAFVELQIDNAKKTASGNIDWAISYYKISSEGEIEKI